MSIGGALSKAAYRLMVWEYALQDLLIPGYDAVMEGFGIHKGFTVVDYGCGPGRYVRKASELVGPKGRVFAADVSEVAVRCVETRIARLGLANVFPILIRAGRAEIPSAAADLAYALDMFHAVRDPAAFLKEIRRIVKPGGRLILEDGHQSRASTIAKVSACSALWKIAGVTRLAVVCEPVSGRARQRRPR
jgi:ubiquinone/menaquinone biosynthesis C-methylase UbiE